MATNSQIVADYPNVRVVSVKDFGAKGDGTTDDTSAFVLAWAAAVALTEPVLYIPRGTYILSSVTIRFIPVSNMVVYGDGMHQSVIHWQDDVSSPDRLIGSISTDPDITNLTLHNFAIRGAHGDSGDFTQEQHFPILIKNVTDSLNIHDVQVSFSRVMGIVARNCVNVNITDCWVHHSARDGINTQNCRYVRITDNTVEFCDDDMIASHFEYFDEAERSVVISNNTLRFGQGIKSIGADSHTITGNSIDFCFGQGISVISSSSDSMLRHAENGIVISGNVIKNCIDRQAIDGLNTSTPYIAIGGDAAMSGTLTVVPGENDSAAGDIEDLYQYFANHQDAINTTPIPNNYNIIVSNNICVRDIAAQTNISDLGYGAFYIRTGPNDPAIALTDMDEDGVRISNGLLKNAIIANNVFMGIGSGLALQASGNIEGLFVNNIIFDVGRGIVVDGSNTGMNRLYVRGNLFDIDPLHLDANRGSNGTYSVSGNPVAILVQNTNGLVVEDNIFRNCCRVSDKYSPAGDDKIDFRNNIIECEPAATSFSTSNKGVGLLPEAGTGFLYRVVNSDPASSTYGDLINVCFETRNAIPTTGVYVRGHFVRNSLPTLDGNSMVIFGWIRLTTGSSHSSGTDWAICYTSHVSPAT